MSQVHAIYDDACRQLCHSKTKTSQSKLMFEFNYLKIAFFKHIKLRITT